MTMDSPAHVSTRDASVGSGSVLYASGGVQTHASMSPMSSVETQCSTALGESLEKRHVGSTAKMADIDASCQTMPTKLDAEMRNAATETIAHHEERKDTSTQVVCLATASIAVQSSPSVGDVSVQCRAFEKTVQEAATQHTLPTPSMSTTSCQTVGTRTSHSTSVQVTPHVYSRASQHEAAIFSLAKAIQTSSTVQRSYATSESQTSLDITDAGVQANCDERARLASVSTQCEWESVASVSTAVQTTLRTEEDAQIASQRAALAGCLVEAKRKLQSLTDGEAGGEPAVPAQLRKLFLENEAL